MSPVAGLSGPRLSLLLDSWLPTGDQGTRRLHGHSLHFSSPAHCTWVREETWWHSHYSHREPKHLWLWSEVIFSWNSLLRRLGKIHHENAIIHQTWRGWVSLSHILLKNVFLIMKEKLWDIMDLRNNTGPRENYHKPPEFQIVWLGILINPFLETQIQRIRFQSKC